jgi:uncharacterized protein (AIM24 family)
MNLIETKHDVSYGGLNMTIAGELVPVCTVTLKPSAGPVFFEHHILLWRDPQVEITAKTLKGMGKRVLAGLPVVVTEASGSGRIAFSRDATGQLVLFELGAGEQLDVREHQFLFATASVEYSYYRLKGISNLMFGGSGFFIDTFKGPGLVAVHGFGNVLERDLAQGEQIDVEPGAFMYKDARVRMETQRLGVKTGLMGGTSLFLNRFTGPGKLGIQSMTFHLGTGD